MAFYQSLKNQYKSPALRSMGIYTITNFFGKGLSFLLLPLFTNPKYLSPADNGLLSLFSQAVIFLMPFISLGILQSASVDYFKLDQKKFRDFCTTGFFLSSVMTILTLVVFFIFKNFFFHKYSFPKIFLWAIPLIAFMTFCYELLLLFLRNRNNATAYMRTNIFKISTELGLAVTLVVAFGYGWIGRVASILVAGGCVSLYAIYFLAKGKFLSGSIRRHIIFSELKYSVPIILMQLSMFCLFSSDSFLLAGITKNNSQVGIYGMACVFGSVLITLSNALIQHIVPKIYLTLSEKEIDYLYIRKLFATYFSIVCFAFVSMFFVVPFVYHMFIHDNYWEGIRYYYFLSTGYFFWTIAIFFYKFLFFYKRKKKLFALAFTSIVISLSSNYFFIKAGGAYGASISVCCSYFFALMLVLLFTKKYWKPMIQRQ